MIPKRGEKCFAVMPKRQFGKLRSVIPPGRFSFMDARDLRGVTNFGVYEMICKSSLHKGKVFILDCLNPYGCYSCDRRFVENYVFKTSGEAAAKITRILKGRIRELTRKIGKVKLDCGG